MPGHTLGSCPWLMLGPFGNEAKRGQGGCQRHRILDAWGLSQEPWQLLPWAFRNPWSPGTRVCVSPTETDRAQTTSPRPHLILVLPLLGQSLKKRTRKKTKKWRQTILSWKGLSHFLWLNIYSSSLYHLQVIHTWALCPDSHAPPLFLPDCSSSLMSQPGCHFLREAWEEVECDAQEHQCARVRILVWHFLAVWSWAGHLTSLCLSFFTVKWG